MEQVNEVYEWVKLRMPAWTAITEDGKFIHSEQMIEIETRIIVEQKKDDSTDK